MRFYVALSLLVISIGPANAYIDAGSGSYMLQMALAGLMALVFSIKLSWNRLRSFTADMIIGRGKTNSRE